MKRKTKLEIIEETIEIYSNIENHSRKDSITCVYNGDNGKRCAFSRVLIDVPKFFEELDEMESDAYLLINSKTVREEHFKEEYKGHMEANFWQDIQNIHDDLLSVKDNSGYLEARKQIKLNNIKNEWS